LFYFLFSSFVFRFFPPPSLFFRSITLLFSFLYFTIPLLLFSFIFFQFYSASLCFFWNPKYWFWRSASCVEKQRSTSLR
jgi:hypothetical protein